MTLAPLLTLPWKTAMNPKKYFPQAIGLCALVLGGCSYPRVLNVPFDGGGRSLNSNAAELMAEIATPYVVFVSDRNGSQDIYLFNLQEKRLVPTPQLNELTTLVSHPSVSANGRYLVFGTTINGKSEIYLYDRQLEQKRNLTTNFSGEVRNPTISADGSKIAFEGAVNGQWDILVYDRQGNPIDLP